MENGIKELLARNAALLSRNLIPTEELWTGLQAEKVLPAAMIHDVQQTKGSREDTNRRLVEVISTRGSTDTIGKLCDVLLATGHQLLGDALREELSSLKSGAGADTTQVTETADILRKYPKAIGVLSEKEKSDLTRALADKIREMALREVWRRVESRDDKVQLVDARRRQLEEAWKYRDQVKRLQQEVEQLRKALEAEAREADSKRRDAKELQSYIDYMKQSHQREMETQMKFNVANDKSLQKLEEVGDETEKVVVEVVGELHIALEQKSGGEAGGGGGSKGDADFDFQKALFDSMNPTDKLRRIKEQVVLALEELKHLQEDYNGLLDERLYVLSHLGVSDTASLRQSFCDHVVSREEQMTQLRERLAALELAAEEAKADDEMERLRKEVVLKDNRIGLLEQQLATAQTALKNANNANKQSKFLTLGSAKTITKRPLSPHFKHYEHSSVPSRCSSPHGDTTDRRSSITYKLKGNIYGSEYDLEASQVPPQWDDSVPNASPRKDKTMLPVVLAKKGPNNNGPLVPSYNSNNPYQAHTRTSVNSPTKSQYMSSPEPRSRLTGRQRNLANGGRSKFNGGQPVPDPVIRTSTMLLPKSLNMDPLSISQIRR